MPVFNDLLETRPKTKAIKETLDKLYFSEMKIFLSTEDSIKKAKRQLSEWKKIFASHIPDKGLCIQNI